MSEHENRVITNLDAAEYHGMERLSSGGIKQLLRSPAHYRLWKDTPTAPTPAMQFGTAVHTLTLEPHTIDQRVIVMPADAPDRRSNAGRAWHEQFRLECGERIVMSADDFERAKNTAHAVRTSPAWNIIRPTAGHIETSLLWHDRESGALCKARPDYFEDQYCVDLKTCLDASREAFMRQLWNLRYDIQGAFYLEGIYATLHVMPHSFVWAVVETDPPHAVAWYRMGHGDLEIARADIANGAALYVDCLRSGQWRSYPAEVQDIRLPPWARSPQRSTNPQEF